MAPVKIKILAGTLCMVLVIMSSALISTSTPPPFVHARAPPVPTQRAPPTHARAPPMRRRRAPPLPGPRRRMLLFLLFYIWGFCSEPFWIFF